MADKELSYEEKQKLFQEQQFKKKWAKYLKLCPILPDLSNNIGKAPKCNVKGPKKEVAVVIDNKNNKKKKR